MIFYLFTLPLLLDELSVRSKAIDLVDSVLEQSVQYLNSRVEERGPRTLRFDDNQPELDEFHNDHYFEHSAPLNVHIADNFLHSDSENFAITCDLANGAELLKSPTIESISGKSFDENLSPQDEHDLIGLDLHLPAQSIGQLDNYSKDFYSAPVVVAVEHPHLSTTTTDDDLYGRENEEEGDLGVSP